jgi:hypothetical protein
MDINQGFSVLISKAEVLYTYFSPMRAGTIDSGRRELGRCAVPSLPPEVSQC